MSKTKLSQHIPVQEYAKINASFSENAMKMMKKRYLQKKEDGTQETPSELFGRIASAMAEIEKKFGADDKKIAAIEQEFFEIMAYKKYTPAGRTVTNAGSRTRVVANCIVLPIFDSMESIFQTLKDASLLQQAGSGLGFSFSHLRPAMMPTIASNGVSSGPVSFLRVYNEAFGVIKQQGRHGANMAMMHVDHPDILDFIASKELEGSIRNFNISIQVSDAFMQQVIENPDLPWLCSWKGEKMPPRKVIRAANGSVTGVEDVHITARQLFDKLVHHAWLNGEPGIVFLDEVNRTNPLPGLGDIDCSNPCGEQFLHHYDNCNLGSLNLAEFVKGGTIDWDDLIRVTKLATRLMDNVIETFDFPVQQVTDLAQKNRRIGLGIMGFADMLYQLGIAYDSAQGQTLGEQVMKTINAAAHEMSRELARERGSFENLPLSIYAKQGVAMRNAALTTVAPTGSISMMFDTSSGIEPNFALSFVKQDKDGIKYHYFNRFFEKALDTYSVSTEKRAEIKETILATGSIQSVTGIPQELKKTFVVAMDISAENHMKMQAAFQRHVDNSISKTINFPGTATHEDVAQGFITAWQTKCKSATVYRDGSREVQVLNLGTGENIKSIADLGDPHVTTSTHSPITTKLTATALSPQEEKMDEGRIAPRTRPEVMSGKTYKIKTGYGTLYLTINNDEDNKPFEVFTSIGKSGGYMQEQSEAIGRLISLSLRAGVKIHEIINQLKGIRGPMPTITSRGTILSLPDAIGRILQDHVQNATSPTGNDFREAEHTSSSVAPLSSTGVTIDEMLSRETGAEAAPETKRSIASYGYMPGCPDCGEGLHMSEGCMSCSNCGFSRCM
jgi:ribonucleoside-diphosphate reductase alpha chain